MVEGRPGASSPSCDFRLDRNRARVERFNDSLVEAVVSRANPASGRTVHEIPVEDGFEVDIQLVGLSRDGRPTAGALEQEALRPGDVVALEVAPAFFFAERRQEQFSLTKRLRGVALPRTERATLALAITGGDGAAGGVRSHEHAECRAARRGRDAHQRLRHLSRRVEEPRTGDAGGARRRHRSRVGHHRERALTSDWRHHGRLAGDNAHVALAVVFLGAIVMTNLITNAAAAAFMFPIALAVATTLQVNFMPFVIILMLGTSYAFINPAGYQTNLMVYEPGGYTFADFARVGIPLTLLVGVVAVLLTPIVFPF